MASIDDIFKSELSENEKLAKSYFGKLLISLKKHDDMKIYSLMSGVSDMKLEENVLKLIFSDKTSYDMLNNENDLSKINELLNSLKDGLKVKFDLLESKAFDEYKFTEYLKSEFNKILTIK